MTREEMEAKVRAGYDAWNRHDAAGTVADIADDCVAYDNANQMNGPGEMQAAAQTYFDAFSDLRLDVVSLWIDGDAVVTEWRSSGTHDGELLGIPATGRPTEGHGMGVDQFGDDGLIHHSCIYWDTAKVLQDVGVMPAAGAATA